MLCQDLRQHARQFGELRRGQLRTGRTQRLRPQPPGYGSVGETAISGIAARTRHASFLVGAPFVEFLGQPGLPDARFALNQHQARAAACGFAPALHELFPFLTPPHHGRRRCRNGGRRFGARAARRFGSQYLVEQLASGRVRIERRVHAAGPVCTGDRRAARWRGRGYRQCRRISNWWCASARGSRATSRSACRMAAG